MGIELAGDGDVAVRVEAVNEFVSLVAKVALRGEISGCSSLSGSSGVWGYVGGRRRGGYPWGTGGRGEFFAIFKAIVVHGPMLLLRGGWWAGGLVDVSHPAGVGGVPAKTRFKGVAGAVGEEGGHTGSTEAGTWWLYVTESISAWLWLGDSEKRRHTSSNW